MTPRESWLRHVHRERVRHLRLARLADFVETRAYHLRRARHFRLMERRLP